MVAQRVNFAILAFKERRRGLPKSLGSVLQEPLAGLEGAASGIASAVGRGRVLHLSLPTAGAIDARRVLRRCRLAPLRLRSQAWGLPGGPPRCGKPVVAPSWPSVFPAVQTLKLHSHQLLCGPV